LHIKNDSRRLSGFVNASVRQKQQESAYSKLEPCIARYCPYFEMKKGDKNVE